MRRPQRGASTPDESSPSASEEEMGTQDLFVLAERQDGNAPTPLKIAIQKAVMDEVGIVPKRVGILEHMSLVKTSSGKISRARNKAIYGVPGIHCIMIITGNSNVDCFNRLGLQTDVEGEEVSAYSGRRSPDRAFLSVYSHRGKSKKHFCRRERMEISQHRSP